MPSLPTSLKYDDFARFQDFDIDVLKEIVREGEAKLAAQLQVATAADQRALTILGFQVTALIAVAGGIFALVLNNKPDKSIIAVASILALGLLISIFYSHASVFPKSFCFPGNSPKNWFVEDWHTSFRDEQAADLKSAMAEQCYCLYTGIRDNDKIMELNASSIKISTSCMMTSTILAFIYGALLVMWRILLTP